MIWAKRRFFCDEYLCPRRTFAEETSQVPRRARSTHRLRDALVAAVVGYGRAAAEAASSFGVSWWLVQRALDSAALTLPDVDALSPRMLGIDEHRYRSVRFFPDPATKAWKRYEPWMTTIVDLDTGGVLWIVDGRDSEDVGDWLFARSLQWRLGVQVVAIDPSAAFRKALRMWLPRTAVSVDAFHLVKLSNDMLPEVRQRLTQQVHGRRGRSIDPVWANAGCQAGQRAAPDAAQHRVPRRLGCRERPPAGSGRASRAAGNEPALAHGLPVVERNRSPHRRRRDNGEGRSKQHSYQTHQTDRPGIHQRAQLQNAYPVAQCRKNSGMNVPHGRTITTNREEPEKPAMSRCPAG